MAFQTKEFFHDYTKRGDINGLFNVVFSDESTTEGATRYYAYQNENGAYIIQRVMTSGSLTTKVYGYYGKRTNDDLTTDLTNRATLTYVDYYQLFTQS